MDLREFLGKTLFSLKKEEAGAILGPDEENYRQLVDIAFSREMPLCWRAMWMLDYLAELHPWIAEVHILRFWDEVPKKHPDGVTRSLLRLLSRYDIPEDHQGIAADLCLDWLTKESVPVAIKAFSMNVLYKLAVIYPELGSEFIAVIEEQLPNGSAGYKARAHQITKAIRKITKEDS